MKRHVFAGRRSPHLFEALRVGFVHEEPLEKSPAWSLALLAEDDGGWIIYNPEMGPYWIFFNCEGAEGLFEDLGEL